MKITPKFGTGFDCENHGDNEDTVVLVFKLLK